MRLKRIQTQEDGFTLALVMIASLFISLTIFATVSAVKGDVRLTDRDLDRKQAYEAAEAGIADYQYHLNSDTNYWTKCVPSPANAVNQLGSTSNRKTVPGSSGATYSIELVPATGKSSCSTTDPSGSMIEQSATSVGTFRIRSTGYSGPVQQRIVATFKRSSFLDYVYFTQLETSDPVTYGYTSSAAIAGANSQCSKTEATGRYDAPIPSTSDYCDRILFADGEKINGPLHTNDKLRVCGTPVFGRTFADKIEVSDPAGYSASSSCPGTPNFVGEKKFGAQALTPPATNGSLANVSGATKFVGSVRIVLNGNTYSGLTSTGATIPTTTIPTSGVIYIANDPSRPCTASYSPFTVKDQQTEYNDLGCGNALVSGSYSGQVTIAAENDIVIEGNLCRGSCSGSPSGSGLLGLIANNFVRVRHPLTTNSTTRTDCAGASNASSSTYTPVTRIDAAILSIDHSFIVDHYNCGASLGTLTVNGAISQKYRGPVGIVGSTTPGYDKNYNYDDRLKYVSPPNFLDPVQSSWTVQRQTLDP